MKGILTITKTLAIIFYAWAFCSLIGSMIKASPSADGCGKNFPIDYVIATNLFCEIEVKDEPRGCA